MKYDKHLNKTKNQSKDKSVWITLLIVTLLTCLFLVFSSQTMTFNYQSILVVFAPLLFLIVLAVISYRLDSLENKKFKIMKGAIIGGAIGFMWGLLSAFLGWFFLNRPTIIDVLLYFPLFVTSIIAKNNFFLLGSIVVGLFMGIAIGLIISLNINTSKNKKQNKHHG